MAAQQGVEREGAALPVVVGVEHDEDVFEEKDQSEGPEDEGQHPVDLLAGLLVLNVIRECVHVDVQWGCDSRGGGQHREECDRRRWRARVEEGTVLASLRREASLCLCERENEQWSC